MIKITNDDICSSTVIYCDDNSHNSKIMEFPALLSSNNENKSLHQEQKNEVSTTNSVDSIFFLNYKLPLY